MITFIIITAEKLDDSASSRDDYTTTYSCSTGDSGFSDSEAFRKDPPPTLCQQAPSQPEHATDSDTPYAAIIKGQVQAAGYYKSLTRENIPGTKFN